MQAITVERLVADPAAFPAAGLAVGVAIGIPAGLHGAPAAT